MGYTQWMLVQHLDLTFRFVSESRYAEFWFGRGTLPQVQPEAVRTVEVILHLEQRVAGEVIRDIADMVSRRAKQPLLGGRPLRLVYPPATRSSP